MPLPPQSLHWLLNPLVLAYAATPTVLALAPHSPVLVDAAAATVFASAPLPMVLAQVRAGLLGRRKLGCWSGGLAKYNDRAVRILLVVLVALLVWPLAGSL